LRDQSDTTRKRILKAAYDAIASAGADQISTAAVHHAAQVSRTTLYRYFPTREVLLRGVIDYMSDDVEQRLQGIIAERPALKDRLDIVIDLMIEQQEQDIGRRLLRVDPGFVMKTLDQTLQRNIDIFNDALAQVYAHAAELTGAAVDGELIGNVMTRLFASLTLLTTPPPPGDLRQVLQGVFRALLFSPASGQGLPTDAGPTSVDVKARTQDCLIVDRVPSAG
jgi:AcrR family transcriptional regulator